MVYDAVYLYWEYRDLTASFFDDTDFHTLENMQGEGTARNGVTKNGSETNTEESVFIKEERGCIEYSEGTKLHE